jgi:hypothetical protein
VKSLLRRRPSPAMIVALIALFVSLSGVSYGVATGFIDSREIKNNEVRSRDVRNNEIRTRDLRNNEVRGIDIRNSTVQGRDVGLNTLTGNDVNEATLGKVPSAASADSADRATTATSADSAGSVGGVSFARIDYAAQSGSGFVQILDAGGLKLEARCDVGATMFVQANPSVQNSEISSDFATSGPNDDLDFDPGDDFQAVVDMPNVNVLIAYVGSDGRTVTIHALTRQESNNVRGTTNDCGFFGVAQVAG